MKQVIRALFSIILVCSLCSCTQSKNPVDTQENSNINASVSTTDNIGTRSSPYNFTDSITIVTKDPYNDNQIEYTINLKELWGSDKVSTEFPSYNLDQILVRGQITVNCDSTDDEINFGLRATYVTSSLNEEAASIQTYKKDELNNHLRTVYSGGSYDIIIFGVNDGMGALDIPLLKIGYTDIDGNNANVWIQLPENEKSDVIGETIQDESPIDTDIQLPDKESEDLSSELQKELTPEELDALLLEQPMYVESTEYVVQDEKLKALYPDILKAVIRNNSGTDVKNAVVAFVAWDENNFPVKIYSSGVDINGSYVKECLYNDVNMLNGTSHGEDSGLSIDEKESKIATFKAIVVSYEDFNHKTWDNPYY